MLVLRKLVLLVLASGLFFSSVGLPVYQHICKLRGTTQSVFKENLPTCAKHATGLDACERTAEETGCCKTEYAYELEAQELIQNTQTAELPNLLWIALIVPQFLWFLIVGFGRLTKTYEGLDPPPLLSQSVLEINRRLRL